MTLCILRFPGGSVVMPPRNLVLVDREEGGNLIVNPPREVWERGELSPEELGAWGILVAATGSAMLTTLPQLQGGCVNYWEAGNWALNQDAPPAGLKDARMHRRVHLHLLGRSPRAKSPSWAWGEAPTFPRYGQRFEWAAAHRRFTPEEINRVVAGLKDLLTQKYEVPARVIEPASECPRCLYPFVSPTPEAITACGECLP